MLMFSNSNYFSFLSLPVFRWLWRRLITSLSIIAVFLLIGIVGSNAVADDYPSEIDGFVLEVGRSFDSHIMFRVALSNGKQLLLIRLLPNLSVNPEVTDVKEFRVSLSYKEFSELRNYLEEMSKLPVGDNFDAVDGSTWSYKFISDKKIWRYSSPLTNSDHRGVQPLVRFADFLWDVAKNNEIDLGDVY